MCIRDRRSGPRPPAARAHAWPAIRPPSSRPLSLGPSAGRRARGEIVLLGRAERPCPGEWPQTRQGDTCLLYTSPSPRD
eukprot:15382655-Alexandrium_andersonii.AAC.1